ncbi:MAG: 30S ribosomal protein S13 [Candidatus Woesearchaeota archaeon]
MAEQKDFRHIVRIANTDLDGRRPILNALTAIRGVGHNFAASICNVAKVSPTIKAGDLTDDQINKIAQIISSPEKNGFPIWMFNRRKDPETGVDKHLLLGDLAFTKDNDIKMLKKIRSYRGMRHALGQPTRGQRTKSNFRKNKGKVMGVQRKAVAATPAKTEEKKKKE